MLKNILMLILVICSIDSLVIANEVDNVEKITTTLNVYPKVIQFGDTIYYSVQSHNGTDTTINRVRPVLWFSMFAEMTRDEVICFVVDGDKRWDIYHHISMRFKACSPPVYIAVKPNSSAFIFARDIRVADLEDMHEPFWLDFLKNLPPEGKEVDFCVDFKPKFDAYIDQNRKTSILQTKIVIKPRSDDEMNLLEEWHRNTPESILPRLYVAGRGGEKNISRDSIGSTWTRKDELYTLTSSPKNQPDYMLYFLRMGNRYPGSPNLPKDWRGWKELEESFCEGTLRDEIRWTRICIQYCETKDEKVLEELKSWLEKMNPIQRAVMVNYIQKNEQLPESIKLHDTIQPFKNKPITNDIDKK